MTTTDAEVKWGITKRRITKLCNEGRIQGAEKFSKVWIIPVDAKKPEDNRRFNGSYMKKSSANA